MDPGETHEDFADDYPEEHDDVTDQNSIEERVTSDFKREVYVIQQPGGGVTAYGWDNTLDEIERLHLAFGEPEPPSVPRGSVEAYDTLINLRERAKRHYDETGEQCVAMLSGGLSGLEGHRVEVIDSEGDRPRRFVVGKSTGWIPVHLELARSDSSGGGPARPDYYSVTDLGRVR